METGKSLYAEVTDQLQSLEIPSQHKNLVKQLQVATFSEYLENRREIYAAHKMNYSEKDVLARVPGGVSDDKKGVILIIADFRLNLTHEVAHLVWRNLLTDDQRQSFKEISKKQSEESITIRTKMLAKDPSKYLAYIECRGDVIEETFAWSYSLKVLDPRISELSPRISAWFDNNVFQKGSE